MVLKDKFLSKSNSYNYYKNNYNVFKKENKKINEKNNRLKNNLKNLKTYNNKLNKDLNDSCEEIIKLQKKLGTFSKPQILNKLINEEYSDLTIAIKTPNPVGHHHWGDYFFAVSLKKAFEKKGFNVLIHERENWYDTSVDIDINFFLRGKYEWDPIYDSLNIMWNIYDPEKVTNEEYEKYDICFISSIKHAENLSKNINTVIKPLLQCTDPEIFYPEFDNSLTEDILFVGSTRGVYRDIIKDIMDTDFDVTVYGRGWPEFIENKYVKGSFIPNEELHKYYSSCKILLNDHWETMKELDFPSNRLFDALACGAFVISDKITSAETLFEGNIVTYDDVDDLNGKLKYYLNHEEERKIMAEKGRELVLNNHTFDDRVDEILKHLKTLNKCKLVKGF